jgi:Tol biopolymer transport system component
MVAALMVTAGVALVPSTAGAATEGATVRVSLRSDGTQSALASDVIGMSADGNVVLYSVGAASGTLDDDPVLGSAGTPTAQLYVRDIAAGTTELASVFDDGAAAGYGEPGRAPGYALSRDGNVVVFVTAEPSGGNDDVFVRDLTQGTTRKITVGWDGSEANGGSSAPAVDADGSRILFSSSATNLVEGPAPEPGLGLYLYDQGTIRRLPAVSPVGVPQISADGSTVAWLEHDPGGSNTLVMHALATGITTPVPAAGSDTAWLWLSPDGRQVTFTTYEALLDDGPGQDAYVWDAETGKLSLLSAPAPGGSDASETYLGELSDDGRVALLTGMAGLVPGSGSPDDGGMVVYRHDLVTDEWAVMDLDDDGVRTPGSYAAAGWRSLSADGARVAFASDAAGLVAGDTNGVRDVFVWTAEDGSGGADTVEWVLDDSGTAVSTGAEASPEVPLVLTIDPPTGLGGTRLSATGQVDPPEAPSGFALFPDGGASLDISGPSVDPADPYVVTFDVDGSLLAGLAAADVQVFKDGAVVADCSPGAGAAPDPCVADRSLIGDGDARLVVRTSGFSTWSVGRLDYALDGPLWPIKASATNSGIAGLPVVVPFRLGGDRGRQVLAEGSPSWTTAGCPGAAEGGSRPAGPTLLTYSTRTDAYVLVVWTTRRDVGCRTLELQLRDGSSTAVRFQLR